MKTFASKRNRLFPAASSAQSARAWRGNARVLVRQALTVPRPQASLVVGAANDAYEQEADHVANQVMRMPDSGPGNEPGSEPGSEQIQRVCTECESELQRQPMEEEEEELQPKAMPGEQASVTPAVESAIGGLRGGGVPLGNELRGFFEPRFGHDFSDVRVHADDRAAGVAGAVNARAFTLGNDIVFGPGQFSPATSDGRRLVAHELTHVVQQGG